MRGDNHAHIHCDGALAADALHLAFFQHAQQLGLHGERHVADLIEEDGSVLRLLKLAEMASGRAGERSFFVPEQFRFNQLRRDRSAVQRDERAARPRTALMQRAGYELFSGASLAENADARFTGGYALHLRHHAAHGFTLPDDLVFAEAALQVAILAFQASEPQRVLHGEKQFFGGDRLLQKIERPQARSSNRHLDVRLARHHDHRSRHSLRLEFFEKSESVFAGHYHVRKNQVEGLRLGQFQSLICVVANGGFMTFQTKRSR